jgi:hypothetical protein
VPAQSWLPTDDSFRVTTLIKSGLVVLKALLVSMTPASYYFDVPLTTLFGISLLLLALFTLANITPFWSAPEGMLPDVSRPRTLLCAYVVGYVWSSAVAVLLMVVAFTHGERGADLGAFGPRQVYIGVLGAAVVVQSCLTNEVVRYLEGRRVAHSTTLGHDVRGGRGGGGGRESHGGLEMDAWGDIGGRGRRSRGLSMPLLPPAPAPALQSAAAAAGASPTPREASDALVREGVAAPSALSSLAIAVAYARPGSSYAVHGVLALRPLAAAASAAAVGVMAAAAAAGGGEDSATWAILAAGCLILARDAALATALV